MDFSHSDQQILLLDAVDKLLGKYAKTAHEKPAHIQYDSDLQRELFGGGFLTIAGQDDFNLLDAALLSERVARLPLSVEAAASSLVAPALGMRLEGPLALCEGVGVPTRYLSIARHLCLKLDGGLYSGELDSGDVAPIDGVLAYPMGVLHAPPCGMQKLDAERSAKALIHWKIAIAAEAAGLMRGALDATVSYVKDRRQFNRPLGEFQAIQHRLAICEQIVSGSHYLAMRAAWHPTARDAAAAALYVQQHMRTVVYDCHQFTGAMGVTLEYPLHLWTYRLKLLQGELGGWTAQARALAKSCWN